MSERSTPWQGLTRVGAVVAALVGAASFFLIIGVFGLVQALAVLAAFFVVALLIFRLPQEGDDQS